MMTRPESSPISKIGEEEEDVKTESVFSTVSTLSFASSSIPDCSTIHINQMSNIYYEFRIMIIIYSLG